MQQSGDCLNSNILYLNYLSANVPYMHVGRLLIHIFMSLSVARNSFLQLNELRQGGQSESVHASKRQLDDSNPCILFESPTVQPMCYCVLIVTFDISIVPHL